MTEKLGLSAPWYSYQGKVAALFNGDPDITVGNYIDATDSFVVECSNAEKFMLLCKYLRPSVELGKTTVTVDLKYTGKDPVRGDIATDMRKLFAGNPVLEDVMVSSSSPFGEMIYLLFQRDAIGFYNDDLSNPWGNSNFLAADVAKSVMVKMSGVNFTTNNPSSK